MKNFDKKIVVITGAGSGMGRAYALAFAKQGASLALSDYDQQGLDETLQLVDQHSNRQVTHGTFDVSNRASFEQFAQQVKEELGNAHIVINNAGIEGSANPVWTTTEDSLRKAMEVNYYGVVYGTQAFLSQLNANKEAAIVNVSSIFGLIGTPNHADYCASKFAVRGFTEALMAELDSSHIQVHLVHPGGIATNIARQQHSQKFAEHYFQTSADDIARHVLKQIIKNQPRIVYGQSSGKTALGAKFLPLKVLKSIIWHEMKKVIDLTDYHQLSTSPKTKVKL
ncbi:short-chain dehydrogenase [Gammaproteobacteria bacterium 45_16_T64]|nr:short-chain dehydrogenase [Gammaproteobacteria bacterium 45_16_T64]